MFGCSTKMKVALMFFLALFLISRPSISEAAVGGSIGVLPGYPDAAVNFSNAWLIYKLNLGETKLDAVRVVNYRDDTVVVKIYPADAITTTDGSFAIVPEQAPRKDVGGWVKLALNEIEIPPRSDKLVPFTISIPKNADVGDHAGGIIIQEIEMIGEGQAQVGMRIVSRIGVRIYETVPGEVKKGFEITKFDWSLGYGGTPNLFKDFLDINKQTLLNIGIQNKGNVQITPRVDVEVRNMLGMKIADLKDQNLGVVFPNGKNDGGLVYWQGAPLFGRYKIKATVNFAEEGVGTDSREIAIWVFPYRIIFLCIILFVLLTLVRLIALYFREAGKEKMPIYQVKLGDNLADLGRKFMVPWRKIAKMNFIGEPFDITAGEKLFIPISRLNKAILAKMKENGTLLPSIIERSKESRFKKKKAIIIIIISILVIAGAAWGIKVRRDKVIHEQVNMPTNEAAAPPTETGEKTKAGAYKKSNVDVVILTAATTDSKSSDQLFKKFKLMGYNVKLGGQATEKSYTKTTIEYKPEKKAQAEMVKNDLGLTDVDMQEVAGLSNDAVIYNFAPANEYFDLENAVTALPNFSDSL